MWGCKNLFWLMRHYLWEWRIVKILENFLLFLLPSSSFLLGVCRTIEDSFCRKLTAFAFLGGERINSLMAIVCWEIHWISYNKIMHDKEFAQIQFIVAFFQYKHYCCQDVRKKASWVVSLYDIIRSLLIYRSRNNISTLIFNEYFICQQSTESRLKIYFPTKILWIKIKWCFKAFCMIR